MHKEVQEHVNERKEVRVHTVILYFWFKGGFYLTDFYYVR